MSILRSGLDLTHETIDTTSKAAHTQLYDKDLGRMVGQRVTTGRGISIKSVVPTSTAPFFMILNIGNRRVKLRKISCWVTLATAAYQDVILTRRSSPPTGGTSVLWGAIAYDSSILTLPPNEAVANSLTTSLPVPYLYSAAPTPSTASAQTLGCLMNYCEATTPTTKIGANFVFDFGADDQMLPILTSTQQCFELSFATVPATAPTVLIHYEFITE